MKNPDSRLPFIPIFYPFFVLSWTAAVFLYFFYPYFSWIPLLILILASFGAPFFPAISFYLPIISRCKTGTDSVIITVDDGPEPAVTIPLLKLLKEFGITATFFVIGEKAEKNPEIIKQILKEGHTIGNHSYSHSMTLMMKPSKAVKNEILKTQNILADMGIRPLLFRPPAGVTNPKLGSVLRELGLTCVNFSCRANDFGNRKIENLSGKLLNTVKEGDIVLIHDSLPATEENIPRLITEFRLFFKELKNRDITIAPMEHCFGKPVMETVR